MKSQKKVGDNFAAIGLGALIVFIGSIILAATVGVSMILLNEQITQQATKTMEDSRKSGVNSVIVVGGWVYDHQDDMLFMIEFGSSGEAVERLDVWYQLSCTDSNDVYYYRSAALGDSDGGSPIYVWEVGDPGPDDAGWGGTVDNFRPGARYFFTLDGGFQGSANTLECGPGFMNTHGIDADLWLHLPNGMSTHQVLTLSNGAVIGSAIV